MKKDALTPSKLAELHKLLKLYDELNGNGGNPAIAALLLEIQTKFEEMPKSPYSKVSLNNPRGAGNYYCCFNDRKDDIVRLRTSGMSIRDIARRTNKSSGYVHKIISAQKQ